MNVYDHTRALYVAAVPAARPLVRPAGQASAESGVVQASPATMAVAGLVGLALSFGLTYAAAYYGARAAVRGGRRSR